SARRRRWPEGAGVRARRFGSTPPRISDPESERAPRAAADPARGRLERLFFVRRHPERDAALLDVPLPGHVTRVELDARVAVLLVATPDPARVPGAQDLVLRFPPDVLPV